MNHLDFQQLTETERVATYGAFFAMAVADGHLDDEELINIFECLDLEGLSDPAVRVVRAYLITPPSLADALTPLTDSDNDVRYGVLVHLMDVALADAVYTQGERKAIAEAGEILGAEASQMEAIEAFIREVRGLEDLDPKEAQKRLKMAAQNLNQAGIPTKSLVYSGSVAALSAGGIGAAVIGGLGVALVPGIGLAVASGTAAFFAMNLILQGRGGSGDQESTERVITHLQEAITETRRLQAAVEEHTGGSRQEATERRDQIQHLNKRVEGMQRLLARKRAELG